MDFYEGECIHPRNPDTNSRGESVNHHCSYSSSASDPNSGYNGPGIKTLLKNMIFDLGVSCFLPSSGDNGGPADQNRAWLLAETGPELMNPDPHSVHSSFRFSLCSQVELEKMKMEGSSSSSSLCRNLSVSGSSTVLLVNLENGLKENGRTTEETKWKRAWSLDKSISPVANSLIRFSYGEILSATRHFSKGRVLGRGACSYVFRGRIGIWLTSVAIKRLNKEDRETPKSFCRELMIASSLHNPNIVPLLGFCIDPEGLFLVHKYVSGGSLEHYLHDKKKKGIKRSSGLPWSARYKIGLGIANAIAYLHNGTDRCVVHRDIKPSNILLSSKKKPKLCDFGLATWTAGASVPFLCKTVKGTFGYLAPEYFQHGKISDKTDVYAFGVVLLELLTGRKPIEAKRPPGEENLVAWAKPLLHRGMEATEELLDPLVKRTRKSSVLINRMIRAAASCVIKEESRRPGMEEIVSILKGEEGLEQGTNSCLKKNNLPGMIDSYTQLKQTKSEMKGYLALAMVGVTEFEDEDHLYGRYFGHRSQKERRTFNRL
ncbi:PREDICTED: serine/threonine-protein kinase CDL1-like isoform X2 [Tarenaya hassleriana]|uniref:serine/threonine-protein kinase CDL1-like isoform X2 n=1 Tax=Tarenaya hassleriana TaxID=28532 RepID=UPI00053C9DBA|nr:PREDICTED: serine/threonine-protein kinase CDL1-like isoform X2 [Tarenaya hassleriana]